MDSMSSLERCRAVLEGRKPDRVPVVPQAFLFACQSAGHSIGQINKNAKLLAESHRLCQETYGYDGCVIDVDDASLAEACGAKVHFRDKDVATVDEHHCVLSDVRQIHDLKMPDPWSSGRLPVWLEATQTLSRSIGDRVFIMGRADQGPFDLLCLLRGAQNLMMDLMTEDPEDLKLALDWCTEVVTRFALAQREAGAHATSIGDAYAGPNLVSPQIYREFALGPEQRLASTLRNLGFPFSVHICGDTTAILDDMVTTGASILEVDWKVDLAAASKKTAGKAVLMGNIDPSYPLVTGTPTEVSQAAQKALLDTAGRPFFLSSGCALGSNTPTANFEALVNASRLYGTFGSAIWER